MIIFNSVRYKNLLATGNSFTTVALDSSPNTLIIGDNGSGKSTVIEAITFALFGKPYRKINKAQLINSINAKQTLCEVDFTIGGKQYTVRRGIKPALFEIYCNGSLLNQNAAARDYQDLLEKNILKFNYKAFTQICILGSSNFVPFMQLNAAARREIIENLLDIRVFSVMNLLLKQQLSESKEQIAQCKQDIEIAEHKIELHKQYIEDQKKDRQEQITRNTKQIEKTQTEIEEKRKLCEEVSQQINELSDKNSDNTKLNDKLQTANEAIARCDHHLKAINKSIELFETSNNCPVCSQDISDEFKQLKLKEHNNEASAYKTVRELASGTTQSVSAQLEAITKRINKINELNAVVQYGQQQITALHQYIDKIRSDNDSINNNVDQQNAGEQTLTQLESRLKRSKKQHAAAADRDNILQIAATLLKDQGIKTVIIKQYVPIMNKLINKYLQSMDFFVDFQLDENFNETIKSRHRDVFSYDSFSEGEKQRIDLALLFTWRALARLKNSMSTNLLILDETFDSSLDTGGCEDFLKLLYDLGQGANVFVISHKSDILQDKFDTVMRFEKYKNFSRIVGDGG